MHTSLEEKLNHVADFRVKYRFYTKAEGGRSTLPYQGYRSDFWYDNSEHKPNEIFMIHPEFENIHGEIITEDDKPVPGQGTARMWIVIPERRPYHASKINVGLKSYFMEGWKKIAECEVIEILGLKTNPTSSNIK